MKKPSTYEALIRRHYPQAMPTGEAVKMLYHAIQDRYGLRPEQVVLADSICSDDVNTEEYPPEAMRMIGPFKLGGLNGYPFGGTTGMQAFASHMPANGAILIYYAPHIGINAQGKLGVIHREGQHGDSGCCGACKKALGKLNNEQIFPGMAKDLDHQQETLEQILLKHAKELRAATGETQLKLATEKIYDAISERMDLLIGQILKPGVRVLVVGGILINTDAGVGSYTELRRMQFLESTSVLEAARSVTPRSKPARAGRRARA